MKRLLNIWALYVLDWRRIFRVPTATLLLIAMFILPSLYAWFNIKALWDPYGNTSDLPIAVYSADSGVEINHKKLTIGKKVMKQLHHNHRLGWVFVDSKDQLTQGVQSGKYYAGIYLPVDFSKDLVSFIDGKIQKPQIEYYYNAKINAIAPKITDKGASTLQNEITDNFIATSSKILAETMDQTGISLEKHFNEIDRLSQLVLDTNNHLDEMDGYIAQLQALEARVPEFSAKFAIAQSLPTYFPQVNQLADKVVLANQKVGQINQAGEMLLLLQRRLPEMQNVQDKLAQVNQDFTQVNQLMQNGIHSLTQAVQIVQNIQALLPQIGQFNQNAQEFLQSTSQFAKEFQTVLPAITQSVVLDLQAAQSFGNSFDHALAQMIQTLQLAQNSGLTPEQKQNLTQLMNQFNQQLNQQKEHLNTQIAYFESLQKISGKDFQATITRLKQALAAIDTLQTKVNQFIQIAQSAENNIPAMIQALSELQQLNQQLLAQLKLIDPQQIANQINQTLSSLVPMLDNAQSLLSKAQQVNWTELVNQTQRVLQQGLQLLEGLQEQLPSYQQKFNQVTVFVDQHYQEFVQGLNQASAFYQTQWPTVQQKLALASQFAQNDLPKLEQDYQQTLNQLNAKMPLVQNAFSQINQFIQNDWPIVRKGIQESAQSLQKGQQMLSLTELIRLLRVDAQKEADFFKEPVTLKTQAFYPIKNNGSASAPFYTALCLWVGSLLLSSLATTNVYLKDKQQQQFTLREQFFSRMLTFLTIALVQSLIVVLGNLFLLHVSVKQPFLYVLFTVLIGLSFMSIIYVLVSLFGNVGKGIGIVLLVLSISGGGGNYPIQVSGAFFQWINPWLPFTYAVNLLREATGGIYWPNTHIDYLFLMVVASLFIILGAYFFPRNAAWVKHFNERTKNSHFFH